MGAPRRSGPGRCGRAGPSSGAEWNRYRARSAPWIDTVENAMAVLPSKARPALIRAAQQAGDDYGVTAQPSWREINRRDHLRSMDIDGGHVNYLDMGSGVEPTVLLVHGLAGRWQTLRENLPRVAQQPRV